MEGSLDVVGKALAAGKSANATTRNDLFVSTAVLLNGTQYYPSVIALLKQHGLDWKAANTVKGVYPAGGDRPLDQEEENFYWATITHKTAQQIKEALDAGADPTSLVAYMKHLAELKGDPAGARVTLATLYRNVPNLAPVEAAKPPPDPSIMGVRLGMSAKDAIAAARAHGLAETKIEYAFLPDGHRGGATQVVATAPRGSELGAMYIDLAEGTGRVVQIQYGNQRDTPAATAAACVAKWGEPATFDKDGKPEPPTWGDPDHVSVRCEGSAVTILDKDAQAASRATTPATVSTETREKF